MSPATGQALVDTLTSRCRQLSDEISQSEGLNEEFSYSLTVLLYFTYSLVLRLDENAHDQRKQCVQGVLLLTEALTKFASNVWPRGVPTDAAVILLPSRLSYWLLVKATGVVAGQQFCAKAALKLLEHTLKFENTLTSVSVALLDLLHSHAHMAPLVADLCIHSETLSLELVKQVGRSEYHGDAASSGIRNVAPFVTHMAQRQPKLVLSQMSILSGHWQSSEYVMRNALVTSVMHLLIQLEDPPKVLWDVLWERVYDVSSYTRSTVLKSLVELMQHENMPKQYWTRLAQVAMDRLKDKAVLVRKAALQLLTALLPHNPFHSQLNPQPYQSKIQELQEFIMTNLPEDLAQAHQEALQGAEESEHDEINQATLQATIDHVQTNWTSDDSSEEQQDYLHKVKAYEMCRSALEFINVFDDDANLHGMLLSANTSDVTQALRFLVQANHFCLPCAVQGMKRSLALMWSSEASIRNEVLQTFTKIFLYKQDAEMLDHHQIAKNLLLLVGQASTSELASIEQAITQLVQDEQIPGDVFLILWSIVSKGSPDAKAAAMHVLAMGARADAGLVDSKSRLRLVLELLEEGNIQCAGVAALALQRCARAVPNASDAKFLVLERLMEELCLVVSRDSGGMEWFAASEQAIKALFCICPAPEAACQEIIWSMYETAFDDEETMARFWFVLGQVALELLVYTENLSASVRRANAAKSLKQQEENKDEDIEAELGIAAETEAENERQVNEISQQEILGRGLIRPFLPLLVKLMSNSSGILLETSTLALTKFMCVSCSFCEEHLPLLFRTLEQAPDTTMRANTVVALGDLALRFPNEVEPYTHKLYACLNDDSTKVRRHTLMVLTHLILNDMIKVKGQVGEIALCLEDNDARMRDMARLLFHELAKRSNNPIYNLLPEITSQLLARPQADFRQIMSFLLGYIQKDRQNEQLVEKLCQRFKECPKPADLAYCLAQLKTAKTLADHFSLYQEALADPECSKIFLQMAQKSGNEEWEAKITQAAQLGAENQASEGKAKTARRKNQRRRQRKALATIGE